jgi:thymidylate synthase (FAD)
MTVKIIAYTQWEADYDGPIEPKSEDIISYCARVSNPSNQENFETSEKLLKYCMKHKHWSIFEMANVVMEINTTRDIARQILRHRNFNFQEFSQRYAEPGKELGFSKREARFQDSKNRQASIMPDPNKTLDQYIVKKWDSLQDEIIQKTKEVYDWAIEHGIAKEQARAILPEGLTMSRMYLNGTVRQWYHFCEVRRGVETQKEHRKIAEECWNKLIEVYPFLETM